MRLGPQGLLEYRDPQALLGLQDLPARMDKKGPLGHQVCGLRFLLHRVTTLLGSPRLDIPF